jgi:GTPase KRas protein
MSTLPLNVVLIGAAGSGKSSLTIRFIANRFVGGNLQLCSCTYLLEYEPTLEDSYRIQVDIDDHPEVLDIFDTAGTDDYAMVRDTYIREGEAFVCVYSITNEKSFEQVN